MLDRSQSSRASEEAGADRADLRTGQDRSASTSRFLSEAELETAEKALQSLLAEQHEAAASPFDEAVMSAARELVWAAAARWASDRLGEPGAHTAYLRDRLAGI
jgi:hypothetical protein